MSLTRWQPKGPKNSHVAVAYSGYQMSITEKKETNCQRWLWLMDSWWRSPSPQAMTWPTNGPLLPALKPFTINIQDTSIQSLLLHVFVVGQKFRRATLLAKKSTKCKNLLCYFWIICTKVLIHYKSLCLEINTFRAFVSLTITAERFGPKLTLETLERRYSHVVRICKC